MKKIMFFCIPAHGHHNPTFPVVRELVRRGNAVRYYSFEEFRDKVEATGADFFSCDEFLPALTQEQECALKKVSTTEMSIVDIQTTARMDRFLQEQVEQFQPDVIVSDSVCFWGKLTARKYKIPLVVSTTTFAFNQQSSRYMKQSFQEIKDVMLGIPRVNKELRKLEAFGYHEKSVMPLVQNDNFTDTIVYATRRFQPCAESFSGHYAFVGPSVSSQAEPRKDADKPLVYISLGTVINERPDFYRNCIQALAGKNVNVLLSCGRSLDLATLGPMPENIQAEPYVDQMEVLSRASVFITHCGMNSASESLYMGTPMVLFPQTSEQQAVARRIKELGAGLPLKDDSAAAIEDAVMTVLQSGTIGQAALDLSQDFRKASGPAGAAEFIEAAPHVMPQEDRRATMQAVLPGVLQLVYWAIAVPLILLIPKWIPALKWWVLAIAANVLFPLIKPVLDRIVTALTRR